MEGPREAQWAPDPYRRHELRYWDGSQWTEHVSEGDGSVLVDPPLPGPRTRREAQAAAGTTDLTSGQASVPARVSSSGALAGGPAAFPTTSPTQFPTPSAAEFPAMSPVVIPPAAAAAPAETRVSRTAAGRAPDLFNDLPGGRRAAGAAASGAAGPAAVGRQADLTFGSGGHGGAAWAAADDEPEGWDWRESHIPEILSGLGVAALIAVAAVLGGGSTGSSADAVQSVVSTPTGDPAPGATVKATTKKPKKRTTVPGVQLSSAKAPRITYRSSTSAAPRATTTSRTRTTSAPPSSSPPPDETTTSSSSTSKPPTDPPPTNDSSPSSSSSTKKK
ncbi:DUF2510 domain-containing protein [Kineosporia sp. A_224]|uniref:DUF2510 domain-containing protein n=1 Tax=Kineosporia sp. A_224 TaxID=1962180 RepID=UPI001304325E|nr:DUF2510 domain-containing protein [Kineosporia sp. A_224]